MPRVLIAEAERSRSLQWHHENRDHAKANMRARQRTRYERIAAIKLAVGCMDCGYDEHSEALDFDHRPGEVKLLTISQTVAIQWERLEAEMEKCDVVCANCHRVRTATRLRAA